ncbi:hypothetical protein [Halorussus vallis]|uniref:hypothetical protein n=1 Tax=Halorussus vallis TaxID=2953749 RepID=UPI0020A0A046|nr:hypothetical protein [Halorussus vallis]
MTTETPFSGVEAVVATASHRGSGVTWWWRGRRMRSGRPSSPRVRARGYTAIVGRLAHIANAVIEFGLGAEFGVEPLQEPGSRWQEFDGLARPRREVVGEAERDETALVIVEELAAPARRDGEFAVERAVRQRLGVFLAEPA